MEPVARSRVARSVYRFVPATEDLRELVTGMTLEINGMDLRGELADIPAGGLVISFGAQFDYRSVPQPGVLRPVPNDTSYQIRLAAIEALEHR